MSVISKERLNEILLKFEKLDPLLVFGDVGIDKYTFGDVQRISPEAPVPILKVTKEWFKLGLAANVSDNLTSFKVKSTLVGAIGEDSRAALFESLLEEKKLSLWGIVRSKGRMTTQKERIITNTQQICRVDYEDDGMIPQDTEQILKGRFEDFARNHTAVIIEDYGKGTVTKDLCGHLTKIFSEQGKFVAVDPSRHTSPLFYQGVDLLKPNRIEAEIMVSALGYNQEKDVTKMATILAEKLNVKMVVITLGKDGMALLDTRQQGNVITIPTVANEVFDVSGAGDTAISAIAACLSAGTSLEEAAWMGNAASGVVVGKKGTATVSAEELQEFHAKLTQKLK